MTDLLEEEGIPQRPDRDDRIRGISLALFYTYFWGWYAGFIEMPRFSIQGLLSSQPFIVVGVSGANNLVDVAANNQVLLRRYRLLSSLFADESDSRFETEHFGFFTPKEAQEAHEENYAGRFKAYFGRVLGEFLGEMPVQYRQQ